MSNWIFLVVGPFLTSRHLRHNRLVRRKDKPADLHVAKKFVAKCFTVKPQHQPEKTIRAVLEPAVFNRWSDRHCPTEAPAGGSDRPVRSVPGTGCTGPAGTGRTNLSDQLALASVGQCPSEHRSNTAVRAPLEQPCSTG
ncbi:hypothetical protein PCASD_13524 [Puccinia coronata f. sp. avenae]|uniref:Uncharacterized protein n=1 Tax=Puccinia coronata f. sp. avenae TaxID=200324 RepID=A0A2N5U031_9BASI|nr:hypothetical protein PCASD_13524 [Puccinia coronata f. sp. avenae]